MESKSSCRCRGAKDNDYHSLADTEAYVLDRGDLGRWPAVDPVTDSSCRGKLVKP
jgi:hypothetical protein